MSNTNHASEEILKVVKEHLNLYAESIREVADEILKAKVSDYPVFIAYKEDINLGRMIINKDDMALEWHINASTLEEFVTRKIIHGEKLTLFRQAYKDPNHYICLFLIHDDGAHFIFHPYDAGSL